MSVEKYTATVVFLYMGLSLLFILIGIVDIWNRIRKRPARYWWGTIPCFILYLISATLTTISASIAYDDPTDPNYASYGNWGLRDFILHDIKTFMIWLFIGGSLYFVFGRRSTKRSIKIGCAVVFVFLMIVLAVMILLSVVQPL